MVLLFFSFLILSVILPVSFCSNTTNSSSLAFFSCPMCLSGCCYPSPESWNSCQNLPDECTNSSKIDIFQTAGYQKCSNSTCSSGCCLYTQNLTFTDVYCLSPFCQCQADPDHCAYLY